MSALRFNTDQGQSAVTALRQAVESMQSELNRARASADGLVSADWEAPAAHQFADMSRGWQQVMNQSLERLTDLTRRLETEIAQWEETAAAFGAGAASVGAAVAALPGMMFFDQAETRIPDMPGFEPEEAPSDQSGAIEGQDRKTFGDLLAEEGVSTPSGKTDTSAAVNDVGLKKYGSVVVKPDADSTDCVRFVKDQRGDVGYPKGQGNPIDWIPAEIPADGSPFEHLGYYMGTEPRPGAIMVEGANTTAGISSSTGHASFVDQVNPDGSFHIVEGNWSNARHEQTFSADYDARTPAIFIYGQAGASSV